MQCSLHTIHFKYTITGPCSRLATHAKLQCSMLTKIVTQAWLAHVHTPSSPETSWNKLFLALAVTAMETTLTLLHFIPGKQGGLPCKQEVGLKETAHNLVGCFNEEVKADCQEYPAVFIVKRASIVGKGEGKNEQGCYLLISGVWILFVFGACQSSSEKKK